MKKEIFVLVIMGMLLLTSCCKNDNIDKLNNKAVVTTTEDEKIEFIDGIYGVYGEDDRALYSDIIEVFKGKDEHYIDISAYLNGSVLFYVEDMEITSNNNGELIATKSIGPEEVAWDYFIKDQDLEGAKLDVILKDNKVKLEFNVDLEDVGNVIEKEKINIKAITEENKQKALNNILESDFRSINEEVFEIISDTENYLAVRVKNYIYWESPKGKDYGEYGEQGFWKSYYIEGCDSIGMDKYYNIDKKNKKVLELDDIIKNRDELNEYLSKAIKEKYDEELSDKIDLNDWNNMEFQGIGVPKVFENYFLIDEEKKTVKVRCLGYLSKKSEEIGDICIEVPFNLLELKS